MFKNSTTYSLKHKSLFNDDDGNTNTVGERGKEN